MTVRQTLLNLGNVLRCEVAMQTNSNQLRIDRFFRYLQHVLIKPWRIPPPVNEHIVCQVGFAQKLFGHKGAQALFFVALFELMFVNVQGANLRIKRRCR